MSKKNLEEKINQEKTREKVKNNPFEKISFLDEIKSKTKKMLIVYLTAIVLALGAGVSGCGKSYCCKHLSCGSDYVCKDTSSGNYCIKDAEGKSLECCECEYSPYDPNDAANRY